MSQNKVTIVNIKRSTAKLSYVSTIMESIWLKNEGKLKSQGWLLKDSIDKVEIIEVNDGLGLQEVEIVEAEEVKEEVIVPDDISELDALKAELKAKGIKFHHASKEAKLRTLLEENK